MYSYIQNYCIKLFDSNLSMFNIVISQQHIIGDQTIGIIQNTKLCLGSQKKLLICRVAYLKKQHLPLFNVKLNYLKIVSMFSFTILLYQVFFLLIIRSAKRDYKLYLMIPKHKYIHDDN